MLVVALRDTAGVKYAEDYVKLSVAQSAHIFPETVCIVCVCVGVSFFSVWLSGIPRGSVGRSVVGGGSDVLVGTFGSSVTCSSLAC